MNEYDSHQKLHPHLLLLVKTRTITCRTPRGAFQMWEVGSDWFKAHMISNGVFYLHFVLIRIYFSDLRSSAEVRQVIARVFQDWITGCIIQAVHRLRFVLTRRWQFSLWCEERILYNCIIMNKMCNLSTKKRTEDKKKWTVFKKTRKILKYLQCFSSKEHLKIR